MNTLIVRHLGSGDAAGFEVERHRDGKRGDRVSVASPVGFPVEGRPNSDLMRELRWYLEGFLDYPFSPETEHAERVQEALRSWGEQAFTALFGDNKAGGWYNDAIKNGMEGLHIQVSSDDPRVLGWPWEALRDPQAGVLAHNCQIERRLNEIRDPYEVSDKLPVDRVNILLVTARPYEGDVKYRSISRPLVELIEAKKLPARVTVLRPPSFERLREHLRERPNFYHIVHFDGHGGYSQEAVGAAGAHMLKGPIGRLVFEDDDGKPDPKEAEQLSDLLRECRIPAVVLNACQSGMVDDEAADPFASVAASLLRAGIRSVVAMAYSLYVSGAQKFLPDFYGRLFETGSAAQATRAGRQKMREQPGRVCARGEFPLQDWLIPVVYQQDPPDLSFAARLPRGPSAADAVPLPKEAQDEENPYGFVGRDGAILDLERAMRRPPAGILIQGLGGVGKTTLARGFVKWLKDTDGLGKGCLWFAFNDIRGAEYVINRMGEPLFGPDFAAAGMDQKIEALTAAFREHPFVIVWDNFEVIRGIPGTPVEATLSAGDQDLLKTFLKKLRGGRTRVLITSRSEEDWLGPTNRSKVGLGGLQGEERWEYCQVILRDLGITINRKDPDLVKLMDLLNGHPLSMRVILPRLEGQTATALAAALQSNLDALGPGGDEAQAKLFATLRFAEQSIPAELRPLLVPLALHEHFVDGNFLADMAQKVDAGWTRDRINRFLETLAAAGLLRDRGQSNFEIHPALTGFLRSPRPSAAPDPAKDAWSRAFVDLMGRFADWLTPRPLHEQRLPFQFHKANFHWALNQAERCNMDVPYGALTQALAIYAQKERNLVLSNHLLMRYSEFCRNRGFEPAVAGAYHNLGMIAQERRDHDDAEQWYRKALEISERIGDERGSAFSYQHLGMIAQERRDHDDAGRRHLDAAERWHHKAREIRERIGDEPGAAASYQQLGRTAQERGVPEDAEGWQLKALEIRERLGDEDGAAASCYLLGMNAQERRDPDDAGRRHLDAAEQWYRKGLEISERTGDEPGAATSYHQLGIIAQERNDHGDAERRYHQALEISERIRDEHRAASTYGQLGILARLRGYFEESGRWFIRSILGFAQAHGMNTSSQVADNFLLSFRNAPPADQVKLKAMWEEAGLGPFPEPEK